MNKTIFIFRWIMLVVAMLSSFYAQAYPGESIVLDPVTGNYTITYWDGTTYEDEKTGRVTPPGLEQTTLVPAFYVKPTLRSSFKLKESGSMYYSYSLSNGKSAKQAIVGISLEQVGQLTGERAMPPVTATVSEVEKVFFTNMSSIDSPDEWLGNIRRANGQSRIVWRPGERLDAKSGILPGRSESGFAFSSPDLPGISFARMTGIGNGVVGYTGEGPAADSAILVELERMEANNFIARPAAIPVISVPSPFNAAVLLDRIQTQMHTWIVMQLLDATFSSQLDRYLTAAVDAYRHNQPKAGKEHIQTLRKMLKKEHDDADRDDDKEDGKHEGKSEDKSKRILIDRLAARVLDFDLKYVLKRMGDD